jgi:hypothetical protein
MSFEFRPRQSGSYHPIMAGFRPHGENQPQSCRRLCPILKWPLRNSCIENSKLSTHNLKLKSFQIAQQRGQQALECFVGGVRQAECAEVLECDAAMHPAAEHAHKCRASSSDS